MQNYIDRLEALQARLIITANKKQRAKLEEIGFRLFDEMCAAYSSAGIEQRIDMKLAFDGRDEVLSTLLEYIENIMRQASQSLNDPKKSSLAAANSQLENALTAHLMLDGRGRAEVVERERDQLYDLFAEAGFNMTPIVKQLEIPAAAYAKRAYQLNKVSDRLNAAKALGCALQKNPELDENEKVVDLACAIVGQPMQVSIRTLEDAYLRRKFVEGEEKKLNRTSPQASNASDPLILFLVGLVALIAVGVVGYFVSGEVAKFFSNETSKPARGESLSSLIVGGIVVAYSLAALVTGKIRLQRGDLNWLRGPAAYTTGLGLMASGLILLFNGLWGYGVFNLPTPPTALQSAHAYVGGIGLMLASLLIGGKIKMRMPPEKVIPRRRKGVESLLRDD